MSCFGKVLIRFTIGKLPRQKCSLKEFWLVRLRAGNSAWCPSDMQERSVCENTKCSDNEIQRVRAIRGKNHDCLGVKLDFSAKGKLKVDVRHCVKDTVKDLSSWISCLRSCQPKFFEWALLLWKFFNREPNQNFSKTIHQSVACFFVDTKRDDEILLLVSSQIKITINLHR